MDITDDEVAGCSNRRIVSWQINNKILLHAEVVIPLTRLQLDAAAVGFDLQVASGYRSFDRQLLLWNDKFHGRRKVLNDKSEVIDMRTLSPLAKIKAVMRWSALPSTSRHHWGTDFDIYDKAAISSDYRLALTPDEYTDNGPFAPMMNWLVRYLAANPGSGFYRPYTIDRQGVAPEPWHISYQPIARYYQQALCLQMVKKYIENSECVEKATIIEHLPFLFNRYVQSSEA
jgi:LAS superfamily LD-carboxypeptidase LdcB